MILILRVTKICSKWVNCIRLIYQISATVQSAFYSLHSMSKSCWSSIQPLKSCFNNFKKFTQTNLQ